MSGFELTPDQVSLRELAAEVAREVYAPKAAEWDRDRTPLPDDEVQRLAKLGFLGMVLPEEYGGHGGTLLDALIVQEELAKECRPGGVPGLRDQRRPVPGHRVLRHRAAEEGRAAQDRQR